MKHLEIRNLPTDIAEALELECRHVGTSLEQTVIDLLRRSLALDDAGLQSNGLGC